METIQIGKVSSIGDDQCSCRVLLNGKGIVTEELPLVVPFTLKNKAYYLPKINETVVCAFVNESQGYILGSFYAETRLPEETGNVAYIEFSDGTKLKYDEENSKLDIKCVGEIDIACKGNFNLKSDANVTINGAIISLN